MTAAPISSDLRPAVLRVRTIVLGSAGEQSACVQEEYVTLESLLMVAKRHRVLIVSFGLAAMLAAAGVALFTSQYRAEAVVMVHDTSLSAAAQGVSYRSEPRRFMQTQIEMVALLPVVERAALDVGGQRSGRSWMGNVSVAGSSLPNGSNLIRVSVVDRDANVATVMANAVAREYIKWTRELEGRRLRKAADTLQWSVDQAESRAASSTAKGTSKAAREGAMREYLSLVDQQIALRTASRLTDGAAALVVAARADTAVPTANVAGNALLGLGVGLALGLLTAWLVDARRSRKAGVG